jgi:UDP-N-acetylmuramoyl-tripeptide--D-alanyl-D-alanine ligase
MEILQIFITLVILLLGIRTTSWHLQNWQLREYRLDRMRAHLRTRDGKHDFITLWYNFWFFKGILPRPRKSGRMLMIIGIFILLTVWIWWALIPVLFFKTPYFIFFIVLIWERITGFLVGIAVFLSRIPVELARKILFLKAKRIVKHSNVKRIGITGSFGKSSTKQILIHLLQSKFGAENVLFNPGNENNEVAIARLIIKNSAFFSPLGRDKREGKFFVVEIGAYRRGEIKHVCQFVQPHTGILTGINAQHIELFGSQRNIQRAKFELAEAVSEKVFFNADSPLLREIAEDRKIKATKIPLSLSTAQNLKSEHHQSTFEIYGEKMTLPWSGAFFVSNALLAIECARETGMNATEIAKALPKLPSLDRALNMKTLKSGTTLLEDLYSANPDGVMGAIKHLKTFPGKKIFVGIPLRELGQESKEIHRKIFTELATMQAEVFWLKPDFLDLGKELCGSRFHGEDIEALKKIVKTLKKNDAILLESRLSKAVVEIF